MKWPREGRANFKAGTSSRPEVPNVSDSAFAARVANTTNGTLPAVAGGLEVAEDLDAAVSGMCDFHAPLA